jgi:carboxymethylenebutenolidase
VSAPTTPGLRTRISTIQGSDGPLAVYEAAPAEPTKAVVIIHEAFGVTDHIADVARRAADAGYYAVAPDFFHRVAPGVAAYGDLQAATRNFAGLSDDAVLADFDATLAHLETVGFAANSTGVIGFCFGGRVAFLAAARRALGAAVTLYGGGIVEASKFLPFPSLLDDIATMKTPWIGLYGKEDVGIPQSEVNALEAAMAQAPVDWRIKRYDGANHAFHNDQLPSYHPEAAKAAWAEGLAWLADHGVG